MRATLAVFLLVATPVLAVLGDLNKDGTVDLEDFFIFADNFGKAGAPEAAGDLRFDGAYWRILGGEIEWLRFYTTGVVQHMITASFSPGSMGEYLYPSSLSEQADSSRGMEPRSRCQLSFRRSSAQLEVSMG